MSTKIRTLAQNKLRSIGGKVFLGESASYNWVDDPARMMFSLSRYKFVSRMFNNYNKVLEIGCADGFGSYLVSKTVGRLTCVDNDSDLVDSAAQTVLKYSNNIEFKAGDITDPKFLGKSRFDGIFLLDVLEHIPLNEEDNFLSNLCLRLKPYGSMIIGMPSKESQAYASELSRIGHINCKTQDELQLMCSRHFHQTFIFGVNDEVVHTGFHAMQHYRLALCSSSKKKRF